MGVATASLSIDGSRIVVRTKGKFETMLAACKRVSGGRFHKDDSGDKFWHYPTSVQTCHALRESFGAMLKVDAELARWYRAHQAEAQAHEETGALEDACLSLVPRSFAEWLRGSQRAGVEWLSRGYRGAGLVADVPGLGKTPQMLAALLEKGTGGPVLVVCPKNAVRLTWGAEIAKHLPGVPTYLCAGTRSTRERVLARFAEDMAQDPDALRLVVVVSEMLRVEMGRPCMTEPKFDPETGEQVGGGNRVGVCKKLLSTGECQHVEDPNASEKDYVPIAYVYPSLFDEEMLGGGWADVVLDESHKLLGSLTISKGNLMGRGLKLLPERDTAHRYAMSGTPFGKGGRVQGMFGTLHWLWPDEYTSFWRWADENFEVEEKQINRFGKTVKQVRGLRGLTGNATPEEERAAIEKFLRSLGPRILRRTKQEILHELPAKQYLQVTCPMTPQQRRQYRELTVAAEVTTKGGVIMANGGLALLTRERQIANGEIIQNRQTGKPSFTGESGKLERLWEKMEEHGILDGAPGPKIVVASEFTEFTDVIAAKLRADGVPYYHFDGRTPEQWRDAQVNAWQSNTPVPFRSVGLAANTQGVNGVVPRVFIVNSRAAGISINLDAADEMHMMDEMWNPEENEQLEDRIHRASRNHQVTILYYRTEGTIDYVKAENVEAKRRAQHLVLDGRRGLTYVREMMEEALALKEDE